ncbi:MAG: TerC family protein [Candidatus Acidiferrales bacterium]
MSNSVFDGSVSTPAIVPMTTPTYAWAIFVAGTLALITVDLLVLHRKPHEVKFREALLTSAGWISLAMLFNIWIYIDRGPALGLDFLTAYLVEKSLSVDNILVFIMVFESFRVPPASQHRVLFLGVVGALALRAIFVIGGVALIHHFHVVIYVFGAFLIATSARMALRSRRPPELKPNLAVRFVRKWFPVTKGFAGTRLVVRRSGSWSVTPLFLALIAVEVSDVLFAVDSVPAVLAITQDTFIAYTSNVFAILGLRSLYFALAGILPKMRYLRQGLAAMLAVVGVRMLVSGFYRISSVTSLASIAAILLITVLASSVRMQRR